MAGMDWSQLVEQAKEGGGFEPLPVGDYDVEVTEARYQKSKATQKDMFVVRFKVVNGPYANRSVWNNFVISPENGNALAIFFRQMNALGLPAEFFAQNPTPEQVCAALTGKFATITVGLRTWQGEQRNEVKGVKAPRGGQPQVTGAPPQAGVPTVASGPGTPAPAPAPAPATETPAPPAAPAGDGPPPPPF